MHFAHRIPVAVLVLLFPLIALAQMTAPAVPPPPQVANLGYTQNLVNQDFSTGILDLACDGQSQLNFWHQGMDFEVPPAPCSQIGIVTDPLIGQKVLNLKWHVSQTNAFDATAVTTMARDHALYYAYGHGYFEVVFRATPSGIGGIWPGFWMVGAHAVIYKDLPPFNAAPGSELDIVELRGEQPTYVSSNLHENGNGLGSAYSGFVPGFDYTQYHKYGYLWVGGGQFQQGWVCMYLDDVQKGCARVNAPAEYQRHFLILSLQMGCRWLYADRSCINVPITGVSKSSSGLVRLSVPSTAGFLTLDTATVSGVGGVPGANGAFPVTVVDGTHLDLENSVYSGAYTGGGKVNALSEANMYVKSVRVWSCPIEPINGC